MLALVCLAPHRTEEPPAGDQATLVGEEDREDLELARGQRDHLAVNRHLVGQWVHDQSAHRDPPTGVGGRA